MLEQEKLADVMVVSTMDRQHVGHAIPALRKGYNILMEKPISPELDKCKEILEVAKDCPGKIIVCHVLRYTTFYNKLKELISSGRIGGTWSPSAPTRTWAIGTRPTPLCGATGATPRRPAP